MFDEYLWDRWRLITLVGVSRYHCTEFVLWRSVSEVCLLAVKLDSFIVFKRVKFLDSSIDRCLSFLDVSLVPTLPLSVFFKLAL